jgi:DNA-damage-inducible protein J
MATKNLQVRLDENLKRKAEAVFKEIGIDTPTAIRVFFAKVAHTGGIPFLLERSDTYTPKELRKLDQLAANARRGKGLSKSFSSVGDLLDDLHS